MSDLRSAEQALLQAEDALSRFDPDAVIAHLSTAIRGFTAAGEPRRAAMACARLGDTYANALGNGTAARAWFARARRLVEPLEPCIEQGWVAVAAMGCDVDDDAELLAAADLALERARRFGVVDLETKALADGGLALVRAGRVAEGMARLDEAMALACGPARDEDTAAKSVCSFFTACHHAADFGRATSWGELLRRRGLISPAPGPQLFLSSHCEAVRASMLIELGRWGEAEAVLTAARAKFESGMQLPAWHPVLMLAELRIRQGRLAEAEALLLGKDASVDGLVPLARLHLARGDAELAVMCARRGLDRVSDDRLRAIDLYCVLAEAALLAGDPATARAVAVELESRTDGLEVAPLLARAAICRARLAEASGSPRDAILVLRSALDSIDPAAVPWPYLDLRIELLRHLEQTDPRRAAAEAASVLAALREVDVVLPPAREALLDRLGKRVSGAPAKTLARLTRRGSYWTVEHGPAVARVSNTKGMRYLAALVGKPRTERHVLDLVDVVEGAPTGASAVDRHRLGDAGPLSDQAARRQYRRRIEELREEIQAALDGARLERAEQLQQELDALVDHLAAAFGLGGRTRSASSAAERARLNVTRALRTAVERIAEVLPEAGALLGRRLRTGLYCAFEPAAEDGIEWIVQSRLNGSPPD